MLCCNNSLVVTGYLIGQCCSANKYVCSWFFSGRVFPNNSDDKTLHILTLESENGNGLLRLLTEIIL